MLHHTTPRYSITSWILILGSLFLLNGCSISYKFNGASIDYATTKTISVADFTNNAALVYAPLAVNHLPFHLFPQLITNRLSVMVYFSGYFI